jgi:DNA modification methylase
VTEYQKFLESKKIVDVPTGLDGGIDINPMLFDFQKDITRWALRRGRACIFADCGLGKTPMQLEWARHIPGKVLIIAPLAVSEQTIREGHKFGVENIRYSLDGAIESRITITNYERMERFSPEDFTGIVLDESSILKAYTGKYRNMIIERFSGVPYRLACTATPAPNDFMELGNHAEFVGAMSRTEMLSMFFVHDGGETQKWRLKGHAESEFWKWVCSWAVMIRKPSDLGYEDKGFELPALNIEQNTVKHEDPTEGFLFAVEAQTLQERGAARKATIDDRVEVCKQLIEQSDEPWLIWCNLNDEANAITKAIPDAIQVSGSDSHEHKERSMLGFTDGDIRILVTKPKIAGYGMNWQHCHNVAFLGLSDSYEQFYQAVRRCWRFGQTKEVKCHIITSQLEGAVVRNIKRKEQDAMEMAERMVENMHEINAEDIRGIEHTKSEYAERKETGEGWTMLLGDCVDNVSRLKDESIDYSVFSPPFASLYTYSNSNRDMGNAKTRTEFYKHFGYLVKELFRVLRSGRLVSFHCMNLPTSKTHDGYIGITDFRGDLIRMFEKEGFIYHSEVVIWKDPVTAMQRTKAIGLLHKQIVKDSAMSRQGIPDYLVTMRKPGDNKKPISGEFDHWAGEDFNSEGRYSIDVWQRYASPVWMDINPSNTLQYRSARDEKDERHICPLQLDVIHRAMQLWTAENDLVLSPFAGIGSEGHEAIKMERRFIGVELKESYFNQACKNLRETEQEMSHGQLFTNSADEDLTAP